MSELRRRVILAVRRAGMEQRLRDIHGLRSREARRDRRDMRSLRVLMALTLTEDASCIDVGANVGAVLQDMVRFAPRGRHVAYEPLPDLAAVLRRDFPQVDVRAAAASDHTGEAVFHRVRRRDTRSSLSTLEYASDELEPIRVRLEDLDSNLPADLAPALIKVDVEGAEEQVVRGAMRLISDHAPIVVFEHNRSSRSFGTTSAGLHGLLAEARLRIFDIDGNGPYGAAELERTVDAGRVWTFVAHR